MQEIKYDYSLLYGKIKQVFKTQAKFAKAINISRTSLSLKLNGGSSFTQEEINNAIKQLCIKTEDIPVYFFKKQV